MVLKDTDQEGSRPFTYEAFTPYGGPFQGPSARAELYDFPGAPQRSPSVPYNTAQGIGLRAVTFPDGLSFSPFARRY